METPECCEFCDNQRYELREGILLQIHLDWSHLGLKYITDKSLIRHDLDSHINDLDEEYNEECNCMNRYGTDEWYEDLVQFCIDDITEYYEDNKDNI